MKFTADEYAIIASILDEKMDEHDSLAEMCSNIAREALDEKLFDLAESFIDSAKSHTESMRELNKIRRKIFDCTAW